MSKEITENKKIIIKPIEKDRPFFKGNHDGKIRYTGCTDTFTLPWSTKTRSYVKIFEDGEQELFEKALDLEEGSLNLYKRKGSWWGSFFVELDKNEKELDLNSPLQALEYRVLKANKNDFVLPNAKYTGVQSYYLLDEGEEQEKDYRASEKTIDAMEHLMKLRKSNKKMYDVLRIMGLSPSASMKENGKALVAEITKVIQQVEKLSGIPNIDDFLNAVNDKLYTDKIFVYDAMEIGEVVLIDDMYKTSQGGIPLGRSVQEAAEFFNMAKNQEEKLLIQRRLELNK